MMPWRTVELTGGYDEQIPRAMARTTTSSFRVAALGPVGVIREPLADIRKDNVSYYRGKADTAAKAFEYLLAKHPEIEASPRARADARADRLRPIRVRAPDGAWRLCGGRHPPQAHLAIPVYRTHPSGDARRAAAHRGSRAPLRARARLRRRMTAPTFLHLGPGKAGSTWVHETLLDAPGGLSHPGQGPLLLQPLHYDRGRQWYVDQFAEAPSHPAASWARSAPLPGHPEAPRRIVETLGDSACLAVTLRDPVDRSFSSYLYLKEARPGLAHLRPDRQRHPELVEEGGTAASCGGMPELFDRSLIHIGLFDDLEENPQGLFDGLTDFLGVSRLTLTPDQLGAKPRRAKRDSALAVAAQRTAGLVRRV